MHLRRFCSYIVALLELNLSHDCHGLKPPFIDIVLVPGVVLYLFVKGIQKKFFDNICIKCARFTCFSKQKKHHKSPRFLDT